MGKKTSYATNMANRLLASYGEESKKLLLVHLEECGILYGRLECDEFVEVIAKNNNYIAMEFVRTLSEKITKLRELYSECSEKGVHGSEMFELGTRLILLKQSLYVMASAAYATFDSKKEKLNREEEKIIESYKSGAVNEYTYQHKLAELDHDRSLLSYFRVTIENDVLLDDARELVDGIKRRGFYKLNQEEREKLDKAEDNLDLLKLETPKRYIKAKFALTMAEHKVFMVMHDHKVLSDAVWSSNALKFEEEMKRYEKEMVYYDQQASRLVSHSDKTKVWGF